MKTLIMILCFMLPLVVWSQQKDDIEEWQKTSCYSKISFRLKPAGKHGKQNIWKIQFKSDYQNTISFNYHISDKLNQYEVTTHRKTLNGNQISEEAEIFTPLEDIYLLVDKVSMTTYPGNFIECE